MIHNDNRSRGGNNRRRETRRHHVDRTLEPRNTYELKDKIEKFKGRVERFGEVNEQH